MENKIIITETDLIPIILEEIPEFKTPLKEEIEYWGGEIPDGLDFVEFSRFVSNELSKQEKNEELLSRCFNLVETFLKNGDEKVKNYIYFMFIENLSNEYNEYTEEQLKSYLGPLSLKALDRINAFWMEGKIIESFD